ncbi:hypothetical protein H6G80_00125 [Nostoc sp. FACHB-87]|uniref:hypothetical protein n=1 Tax=Nostocales TaxID=1161 RepID=UPI001684730A|nr:MULTISPECIES: hypothetical protein [Nostocales]MBD2300947.1 hypothetical protein [Nostoc sp. FACHB-190]MBD2452508.1 hypothetical protein [Nostoc sp. FACHB-87]MBD2473439.1 hypothetical protein [Anabaena sp. FACHB-83]MBD2486103.1 hypothetical protein [Aulosira sp. FACHB-615]
MLLTATDAGHIALEFLLADWNIRDEYREWFTIIKSRLVGESWYIVELGVEGFPDRWFIQVYDTGECDPSYTFVSPISGKEGFSDFCDLPEIIAEVLVAERKSR